MSNLGHIGQTNSEAQGKSDGGDGGSKSSSTGSDSGSTEEEERLRRLFHACDRDGDGFIDRLLQIVILYLWLCIMLCRNTTQSLLVGIHAMTRGG